MESSRRTADQPFLTILGRGASPGLACGPILRNAGGLDPRAVRGAILVLERAVPDDLARIQAAAGTITAGGALLSHVGLLSREYGVPCVSLAFGAPALLLAEGPGLLRIRGSDPDGDAILGEGEIVLIDGHRGTLSVAAGTDPESRAPIRSLYRRLQEFALDPSADQSLRAAARALGELPGTALEFVLEAALTFRAVPEGDAAKRFLAAAARAWPGDELEHSLARIRRQTEARLTESAERAKAEIRSAASLYDVQAAQASLESEARRAHSLLDDLGADPSSLAPERDAVLREATAREAEFREGIRAELLDADRLDEGSFRERAGRLFQLARRANDAGIPRETTRSLADRLAALAGAGGAGGRAPFVVPIDDGAPSHPELVGGKASGLFAARPFLPSACRIPRGFVVTTAAYRRHVAGEVGERLRHALREPGEAAASRRGRAAILSAEVPAEVVDSVTSALAAMADARLAVRSSASVEDGAAGSLAGQFDTFLGVRGIDDLLQRIRSAWASLWHARAIRALRAAQLSPLQAGLAVIIQEMVDTDSAGVVISRDAGRGPGTLLVNATWGLGEAISQGEVSGDLYWVRRSTGELLASELARGTTQVVVDPAGSGTVEVPLPPGRRERPSLERAQLAALAALVRSLDAAGVGFRDIEFGFAPGGGLVVFQVRGLGSQGRHEAVPAEVSDR